MTTSSPSVPTDLSDILPGARAAVLTCMAVQPHDRVLIFCGYSTERIGRALAAVSSETGAITRLLFIDDFAPRPITTLPEALKQAVVEFQPSVTFYAASSERGELPFRMTLTRFLKKVSNPRHGHMPGITEQLMKEGMAVDYQIVHDLTLRVAEILRKAQHIHVTNTKGTDIQASFSPDLKWIPSHGFYHKAGDWGNLPEGEVFTCPASIEGILVADVLGDYFSERYGLLSQPVTFVIDDSHLREVRCDDPQLCSELVGYVDSDPNGRRVGEFAIGTNIGLKRLVGNLLQDEKYPGLHIAFGNPYGQLTGADWKATTHIDVIPSSCTIDVDHRRLMTAGVFEKDILAGL